MTSVSGNLSCYLISRVFIGKIKSFAMAAPYIVHSVVYIFLLVLGDQRKYSEKSEICICLDPCILNRFSLFGPHLD